MRPIDADAIPWTDLNDDPNSEVRVLITFADKVNRMPTIEPERKKGRWIFIRPTKEDRLYVACDQCGQVEAWDENCGMLCALLGEKYAHYCPNCGAFMGEDKT